MPLSQNLECLLCQKSGALQYVYSTPHGKYNFCSVDCLGQSKTAPWFKLIEDLKITTLAQEVEIQALKNELARFGPLFVNNEESVMINTNNDLALQTNIYENDMVGGSENNFQCHENNSQFHGNNVQNHEFNVLLDNFEESTTNNLSLQTNIQENNSNTGEGFENNGQNCNNGNNRHEFQNNAHEVRNNNDTVKLAKKRQCNFCKKKFSPKYLRKHIRAVHEGQRTLSCYICSKIFSLFSGNYLSEHIRIVHGGQNDDLAPINIDPIHENNGHQLENVTQEIENNGQNNELFTHSYSLKSHNKLVHEKPQLDVNRFWQCNWGQTCTKTFKSKQIAQRHIDNVHKGLKKYVCQQCGKSYTQSPNLKSHVQIVHEEISPFMCGLCGDSFKHRTTIKRHMKKVHSGMDVKPEAAEDEEDMEMEGEMETTISAELTKIKILQK